MQYLQYIKPAISEDTGNAPAEAEVDTTEDAGVPEDLFAQ